jgi:hypothetical protein
MQGIATKTNHFQPSQISFGKALQKAGVDHDVFITSLIRGFSASSGDSNVDPDDYFFHLIRQAPEPPLLDLLRRY